MFTGLIEDLGRVSKVSQGKLIVDTVLDDIKIGDSIAVNGICLTVASLKANNKLDISMIFDFSPETLKKTSLSDVTTGDKVNIERAMRSGSRFGGHMVTGHIEGTEKILKLSHDSNSIIFSFSLSDKLKKYIVPKGSVAIDGISLTVTDCDSSSFSVSIIPHTLKNSTLSLKKIGGIINLEPDVLAKYLDNIMKHNDKSNKLSVSYLKEKGY